MKERTIRIFTPNYKLIGLLTLAVSSLIILGWLENGSDLKFDLVLVLGSIIVILGYLNFNLLSYLKLKGDELTVAKGIDGIRTISIDKVVSIDRHAKMRFINQPGSVAKIIYVDKNQQERFVTIVELNYNEDVLRAFLSMIIGKNPKITLDQQYKDFLSRKYRMGEFKKIPAGK